MSDKTNLPDFIPSYRTNLGEIYCGDTRDILESKAIKETYAEQCDLIFFSPPYALQKQKAYKNEQADAYVEWFQSFAKPLTAMLSKTGSIVIEIGNAWNAGSPTMSTATIDALLAFKKAAGLHLCQEIIWHNPARLPSPAQWVTIERSRLKDSFTRIWWLSMTERPKADNRRVLHPYSPSMKRLLEKKQYNAGKRPSEHVISEESFLKDNGGAIAPSVLNDDLLDSVLYMSNTGVDHSYRDYCRERNLEQHPARMPENLARFFISFLTEESDLVFDPFAGSNTTGSVAERLGRRWLSMEMNEEYISGSIARFADSENLAKAAQEGAD